MDPRGINFLSEKNSLLIAPAGYGKTTFLAEALEYLCPIVPTPILVLTHTHAGVASIKKKCAHINIGSKVEITTISGFCQKIVSTFDGHLPCAKADGRPNFDNILRRAYEIVKLKKPRLILSKTYSHIIADEHQDCSYMQHVFIRLCATAIPLHIMADPLQAIFGFNKERMVNFETDFSKFNCYYFLNTPWRWYQEGNNRLLGDSLNWLRATLRNKTTLSLDKISGATFFIGESSESDFWIKLRKLISETSSKNLLILFPNGFEYQINTRAQRKTQFDLSHQFTLLESIDDKTFYQCAKILDRCISSQSKELFFESFIRLLNLVSLRKGDIDEWFNAKGVKRKTDWDKSISAQKIQLLLKSIELSNYSVENIEALLKYLRYVLHFYPKRQELLSAIFAVMRMKGGVSMYDNMIIHRNRIRVIGRKVEGNCIGTTLLTKGLEFEDVIIIDAHKIEDINNLYVALTRASKRLFIFSASAIWRPKF